MLVFKEKNQKCVLHPMHASCGEEEVLCASDASQVVLQQPATLGVPACPATRARQCLSLLKKKGKEENMNMKKKI